MMLKCAWEEDYNITYRDRCIYVTVVLRCRRQRFKNRRFIWARWSGSVWGKDVHPDCGANICQTFHGGWAPFCRLSRIFWMFTLFTPRDTPGKPFHYRFLETPTYFINSSPKRDIINRSFSNLDRIVWLESFPRLPRSSAEADPSGGQWLQAVSGPSARRITRVVRRTPIFRHLSRGISDMMAPARTTAQGLSGPPGKSSL